MTIPEDQVEKLFTKLNDIERKVDTINTGVYGDVNSRGLKKELEEVRKVLSIPLAVVKLPNWLVAFITVIMIDGIIGLTAHTEIVMLILKYMKQ